MATIILNPVLTRQRVAELEKIENRYTFEIFNEMKEKKDGLKLSFLETRVIQENDTTIMTKKGGITNIFPLYKEANLQHALRKEKAAKCIISFQAFNDGDFFAVARIFQERKGK